MTLKSLPDLKHRLMVSIITLSVLSVLLVFYDFLPVTVLLIGAVSALVGIGVWEYAKLASAKISTLQLKS